MIIGGKFKGLPLFLVVGLAMLFLLSTPISFNRLAEIRVALQYVGKGLELVWFHFCKIDFEEFAVHDHLSLSHIAFFQNLYNSFTDNHE